MTASDDKKLRRVRSASNGDDDGSAPVSMPAWQQPLAAHQREDGEIVIADVSALNDAHGHHDNLERLLEGPWRLARYLYDPEPVSDEHARALNNLVPPISPQALGGESERSRREKARRIFERAAMAVLKPSPELDRWLDSASSSLPDIDQRRALAIRAVRARSNFAAAWRMLLRADDAFRSPELLDESRALFAKVSETPGGAGNMGVYAACARLSLRVHAFGDKQKPDETEAAALKRITQTFRAADGRARKLSLR